VKKLQVGLNCLEQFSSIQRGTRSMIWRIRGFELFLQRLKSPMKFCFLVETKNKGLFGHFSVFKLSDSYVKI